MGAALVIHGKIAERQFISDEPMPDVEGPAELIVYPKNPARGPIDEVLLRAGQAGDGLVAVIVGRHFL